MTTFLSNSQVNGYVRSMQNAGWPNVATFEGVGRTAYENLLSEIVMEFIPRNEKKWFNILLKLGTVAQEEGGVPKALYLLGWSDDPPWLKGKEDTERISAILAKIPAPPS